MLDQVARTVAYLLSPLVMSPLLIWLVLSWVRTPVVESVVVVGLATVFLLALPGVFLLWMVRSGRSKTLNLEDRRHRAQAMAIGMAGALIVTALACTLSERTCIWTSALVIAYLLSSGLLVVINRYWRISLHMAAVAGFVSIVWFMRTSPEITGSLIALTPTHVAVVGLVAMLLVGWSRLRLRAHSPAQVVAGALVGLVVPHAILWLLSSTGFIR